MLSPVKIWRNQKHSTRLLGQQGEILSWTIIRVPPDGFCEQAPYALTLVELESGEHIITQCVDVEFTAIYTHMRVITCIRRGVEITADGVIPYSIKVREL